MDRTAVDWTGLDGDELTPGRGEHDDERERVSRVGVDDGTIAGKLEIKKKSKKEDEGRRQAVDRAKL
jgi:hypothetical protein